MPELEIVQRIIYEPSWFEKKYEQYLKKYKIIPPKPTVVDSKPEDIIYGIRREIRVSNRNLAYAKFFPDKNDLLNRICVGSKKSYSVNEPKLIAMLNSNMLFSEDIILIEGPGELSLVHYPENTHYEIRLNTKDGKDLLAQVANEYYQSRIESKLFNTRNGDMLLVDDFYRIIKQQCHAQKNIQIEKFIDMLINFFQKENSDY